jgi:N-acetylglucosamine kinase-like BadF-type ATPase
MSDSTLLLAVDGGGTKTEAVIADLEGNILGRGLGPGSNPYSVGFARFGDSVSAAVEDALRGVLGPTTTGPAWRAARFAAACFGMAGVDSPEDEAQVSCWVREQAVAPSFLVVNDAELILAAGTPDGTGVVLISGTGSICLGRSADGRTARVGGWGTLISDEGSGYDVGLRALRLAAKAFDGRAEAKALLEAALTHYSLPDIPALVHHLHEPATSPAEIAGFAPVVLDLASKGDGPAGEIREGAARELACHVRAVVRRLELRRPTLAMAGGLLRGDLRRSLLCLVADEVGACNYVEDPVLGGVRLARRLLHGPPHRQAP